MATGDLSRGRVQRSPIELSLNRCKVDAWRMFGKHHYLTSNISPASHCYMAFVDGNPAGFCAVLPVMGKKNCRRLSRTVVLPDYQGIGVGSWMSEAVCDIYKADGKRMFTRLSHPALVRHRQKSSKWVLYSVSKNGNPHRSRQGGAVKELIVSSVGRSTASFEYIGNKNNGRKTAK